jgi:tRNA G46 methylase TrmB
MADRFYESHFLQLINYRLAYKAVVTVPTDFSILVEFQDHGANTSTATIKVKVNP